MLYNLLLKQDQEDELTPEQEVELKSFCEEVDSGVFKDTVEFVRGLDLKQREDYLTNTFRSLYKTIINLNRDQLEFFFANKTTDQMEYVIEETAWGEMHKRIKHMTRVGYENERYVALLLFFARIKIIYTAQSLGYYQMYKEGLH